MSIDNNIDFKDHIVQYPNRFKQTTVAPGIVELVPTWIETPEQIIQPGTSVDAELFKKLKENVTCYSQTYTATEGQTVFSVEHPYNVGQSRISVYIGGVKQRTILDFTEASSTSFILKEGLKVGTKVEAVTISYVQPLASDVQQQVNNLLESYTTNQLEINLARTESIQMNRIPENSVSASKLKNSTNSDRIKMANLSDEVLQAMVGNTPINTTPGSGSVSTEKVANAAIVPEKTNFMYIGKNLFDKDTLTPNKFVAWDSGILITHNSYQASDYISVEPSTAYTRNQNHQMAYYDANKIFISGVNGSGSVIEKNTFTTPANARYARFTVSNALVNTFQVEKGTAMTNYEAFGYGLLEKYFRLTSLQGTSLLNKSVDHTKVTERVLTLNISKNLFNKATAINGKFVNWNTGLLTDNGNYYASEFIPVKPLTAYTRTTDKHIAFYNANKTFISGMENSGTSSKTINTPANTAFIRVSIDKTGVNINNYQLEEGYSETDYVAFGYTLPSSTESGIPISVASSPSVTPVSPWSGKRADSLGDSITAQGKWQPYVKSSLNLNVFLNHGIGGTKVSGGNADSMWQDVRINALDSTVDLVTVMGGTNDWAQNVPLGTIGRLNEDVNTFYGACNVMFKKLITRFPDKRILCMGTPYGTYPGRVGFTDTTGVINNEGLMTNDYGKALMKVARLHGIPCVDIGGEAGWNDQNITTYITNDGALLHPNTVGGKRIGNLVANKLKNISF